MEFKKVTSKQDVAMASGFATAIMKEHYDPIVGVEINEHMLRKYQSIEGIAAEIEEGAEYYFVVLEGENIGFVAIDAKEDYMYLSKFYLAKQFRGKGYANLMMDFVKKQSAKRGLDKIQLNVNAANENTIETYKHFGFLVIEDITRQVGKGYAVRDYVMRCEL